MPKYYADRLNVSIEKSGQHMASLHIVAFLLLMISKDIIGNLITSGQLSTRRLRQLSASVGYSTVAAGSLITACLAAWQANRYHTTGLEAPFVSLATPTPLVFTLALHVIWVGLTLQTFGAIHAKRAAVMFMEQYYASCFCCGVGHIGNYYDLTKSHTGLLFGVGNSVATVPSYMSPILCAHLLNTYGEERGWEIIFNLLAVAATCVGVGYAYLLQVRVVDGSDEGARKLD